MSTTTITGRPSEHVVYWSEWCARDGHNGWLANCHQRSRIETVANQLTIGPGDFGENVIKAGDAVTVTVAGVTQPGAGTYTDFTVETSTDSVRASAPSYTISAAGTAGVNVVVNPPTVGTLATYTITGLFAASAITGGPHRQRYNADGARGTVFPTAPSAAAITDSTTPSGSGTVTEHHSQGYISEASVTR